jgi:putative transposase
MDNTTFHKSNRTKELIESKGATILYLPPYSPDFNPIENDFANIKKLRQFNHEKSIDDIIKNYQ